jgi:Amt family ammonium transporter
MLWRLVCGFLVFFMHAGFACLEAGAVNSKNVINIMMKNIMTVCIGAVSYFLIGWAWAYGTENADRDSSKFIGTGDYAQSNNNNDEKSDWFFQMVFAATCATIVSGAVAERTKLPAYFLFALYITTLTYPVVSHWVWSDEGWLTTTGDETLFSSDHDNACGFIDFAGSGVVHMTGGISGAVGAWMVGPRKKRFEVLADGSLGKALPMPGHNLSLSALGTFILWFGWYGFNCGSTLEFNGPLASKVAITTSLAAASACMTGVFLHFALT